MAVPSQAVFGKDIYQELVQRYREDGMRGDGQKLRAKFEGGKIVNSGQTMFQFPTPIVGVDLQLLYDVVTYGPGFRIFVRDAVLTTSAPWGADHFFYCKDPNDSKKFTLPPFPLVATLKSSWCLQKQNSDDEHPNGRVWCATDAGGRDFTWTDYFFYGNPYPKPYEGCSVFRSLHIYSFHLMPNDDGIKVRADLAYDLRFKFLWWHHPEDRDSDFNISKYFTGGLILGGAYDVFRALLARTQADRDCSPALEALLAAMAPTLAAPAAKK